MLRPIPTFLGALPDEIPVLSLGDRCPGFGGLEASGPFLSALSQAVVRHPPSFDQLTELRHVSRMRTEGENGPR